MEVKFAGHPEKEDKDERTRKNKSDDKGETKFLDKKTRKKNELRSRENICRILSRQCKNNFRDKVLAEEGKREKKIETMTFLSPARPRTSYLLCTEQVVRVGGEALDCCSAAVCIALLYTQ